MKSRAVEVGGVLRARTVDARPMNPTLGARERKTTGCRQ